MDKDTLTALAALTPRERRIRLATTRELLTEIESQIQGLRSRARTFEGIIGELQRLEDLDLIAGHRPEDLFTTPALLDALKQRPWDPVLDPFASDAFARLAPGICGYDYERMPGLAAATRIVPKLRLSRSQRVDELAAALTRIHPMLAVDGVMTATVLESNSDDFGPWTLVMADPDYAVLKGGRIELLEGPLTTVLQSIAERYWGTEEPID